MKFSRIKDLRNDLDLTQVQVAEKLGLYTTTYQRYERGENEIPFYMAIEIAKFYNVSLDYLAGSVDKNYQSTALDNEIMQLVSKLDSETKEKLISTLRIWINN